MFTQALRYQEIATVESDVRTTLFRLYGYGMVPYAVISSSFMLNLKLDGQFVASSLLIK